jgi:two-component system, NarL family, sensor histidine kinase DesK
MVESTSEMNSQAWAPPTIRRRSRAWHAGVAVLVTVVVLGMAAGSPQIENRWVPVVFAIAGLGLGLFAIVRGRADRHNYEAELIRRGSIEAIANDRLAVARDLHDIVSHGLGFITTRAAIAQRLAPSDPNEPLNALRDIEDASRQATGELRRMLATLRSNDVSTAPLAPLPALGDINELVSIAARNGLTVRYRPDPQLHVSAGVGVTIFRVVQEALTNVDRHVGPTEVDITCERHNGLVTVHIRDAGCRTDEERRPGGGHGLIGLAERVTMMGGKFDAHATIEGGFEIIATIPDPETARTNETAER